MPSDPGNRRAWSFTGDRINKDSEDAPLLGERPVTFRRHARTFRDLRCSLSKRIEREGHAVDRANAILSVLYLVMHIFLSYQPPEPWEALCWGLEVLMAIFFLLRLISLVLLASESTSVYHTLRATFLIDIVTILPVLPLSFFRVDGVSVHHLSYYGPLTPLNMAYPFRVVRAYYTVDRYLSGMESISQWSRQIIHTYLVMASIMVFTATFIHQTPWIPVAGWHNAMFYTAVMSGTMGFLDPNNDIGRVIIMLFVLTLMISIPVQIGTLMLAQSRRSLHSRSYRSNAAAESPHIIVCGHVTWPSIVTVLRDLLHHQHGSEAQRDLVLLDPEEPAPGLEDMLTDPAFSRVLYIRGSPLEATALWQAHVTEAAVVVVLTNKLGNPEQEDAKVIMITSLVACHCSTPVHAQVHLPENHDRVIRAGARVAVCLQDVQLSLAAKTCLCPGIPTLMANMFRCFEESDHPPFGDRPPWLLEYFHGMENYLFCVPISDSFVGKDFMTVVVHVFLSLETIVIGVVEDYPTRVQLNPGHYTFVGGEMVVVLSNKLSRARKVTDMDIGTSSKTPTSAPEWRAPPKTVTSMKDLEGQRIGCTGRSESFSVATKPKKLQASWYGSEASPFASVGGDLDGLYRSPSDRFSPISSNSHDPVSPNVMRQDCLTFSVMAKRMVDDGSGDHYWDALHPHFHVLHPNERPSLSAVTIDAYVPGDQPHIVVTGDVFPLFPFLLPLRSQHIDRLHPIVFMYSFFPESEWATISLFPQVYVMLGRITNGHDLRRACISKAHRLLILSSGHGARQHPSGASHDRMLEDATAVLGLLTIEEQLQDLPTWHAYASSATLTIVEVRHRRSILLLKPQLRLEGPMHPLHLNYTPRYAAGLLLSSIFPDAFLAATVYNTRLPDVVHQLLSNAPTTAYLAHSRCPPQFADKPYRGLFLHFARRQMVPLGLYRINHGGALLPYVFVNPSGETVVDGEDLIFVLKRGWAHAAPEPRT